MSAFTLNELGMHNYICVINNFSTFKINDKPELHYGMNWNIKSWGHTVLPSFEVKKL